MRKKALLMILDGWGIGNHSRADIISSTPTPYWDSLLATDGTSVTWAPRNAGSVTSVDVMSTTNNLVVSGGPITTSGTFSFSLRGTLKALDELSTTGWLARDVNGDIITHAVSSPSNSISISNSAGANYGDIYLDLPVINLAGTYVDVDTDIYGRVVAGRTLLNWAKLDTTTVPKTVAGYGIIDVYTKTETNGLLWNWSSIINTHQTHQQELLQ